ncbi:MAG: hypothetical protein HIU91_01400 [Acidobacteria bacterium]|nr:hypothetical protein [Acidobacteriota bacterium]
MGQFEAQKTERGDAVVETGVVGASVGRKRAKYRRPSQCRHDMRRALAESFDEIMKGFIEEAKTGSCAHVKLATELLKSPRKPRAQKKGSSVEKLMQKLDWEKLEREQAERERKFGAQRVVGGE